MERVVSASTKAASTPARSKGPCVVEPLVDAVKAHVRKVLAEECEHCADAASDLEQARPGLERRAVGAQAMPPVLRVLDQALLLGRPVAVV